MKIIPLAQVKAQLSACVDEVATQGPIIITRNGKAAAVLLAAGDDEDLERLILAHSPRFQALLERSRESLKAGKGLSRDEFWRQVDAKHAHTPAPPKAKARTADKARSQSSGPLQKVRAKKAAPVLAK